MSRYSVSPPVCYLRIPHGCVHIVDNRESGNTDVDCWSSLGRASSGLAVEVQFYRKYVTYGGDTLSSSHVRIVCPHPYCPLLLHVLPLAELLLAIIVD